MKKVVLLLLFLGYSLFGSTDQNADTQLQKAYAKEFAFLKAQKEMLQKRLVQVKAQNSKKIEAAKSDIAALQKKVLHKESVIENLSNKLFTAQQNLENINDDTSLIESIITQGLSTLKDYDKKIKVDVKKYPATLQAIFENSLKLVKELSSLRIIDGEFYLKDGSKAKGRVIKVGNIATYGISDKYSGALVPAGAGHFKVWGDPKSAVTAQALYNHQPIDILDIFIYENANKEVADVKEKTVLDIINSAGIIGWVIVVLGAMGVLFLLLRVLYLLRSNGTGNLPELTLQKLQSEGVEGTLEFLKTKKGATARVLKATVRNLDRDREHVEDIIAEAILHESTRLDKYSSTILVIAAVAPLLGLLGTVTGMIATFDVITEFGTGDPKLLSGGISIALVTTELGLIVAIPLLLAGNLLNGWSERIKDSMEHAALHIVNEYNKSK